MAYHVNKSDIGHKCLKQHDKKNTLTTFTDPPKNSDEKKGEKKKKTAARAILKLFALHSNNRTWFDVRRLNTLPEINPTL